MANKLGRFVVETHGHVTTLYRAKGEEPKSWTGLPLGDKMGQVEIFDNSPLTLYDMEIYGVDMMVLMPSVTMDTFRSTI
jgi:hypothetical protein